MPRSKHFVAPPGVTCADLATKLAAAGPDGTRATTNARRTLLDSADRRLRRAALYLLCDEDPAGCTLRLHDAAGRAGAPPLRLAQPPTLATDLPDRGARERVAAALGPRTLVAVRACSVARLDIGCRDEDDKLLGEVGLAGHVDDDGAATAVTLSAWPRRGYRAELDALLARDLAALALDRCDGTVSALLDEVLPPTAAELPRRDPPAPRAATPTAAGLAAQLGYYRMLMQDNEPGIRAGIDTEHLHDFRVALRRARTLHGALAGKALPGGPAQAFAWLSTTTSRLRDLDVWCLQLAADGAAADPELAAALAREREREHARLVGVLDGPRYAAFQVDWGDWLEHAAAADDPRTLGASVDQAIARRYARLQRRLSVSDAGTLDYPTLHAVRKDAKKLRYLLDAYARLYPARHVEALLKPLKRLQSRAGTVCDRHAHAGLLEAWLRRVRGERLRATLETALAELDPGPYVDLRTPRHTRLGASIAELLAAARVVKRLSRRHRR